MYSLGKAKGEQKLRTFIDLKSSPSNLRPDSVYSRECLDAPAVLPTWDPGGEHLFIKKKRKVSRIKAAKTSLFRSTEISCKRKRSNLLKALLEWLVYTNLLIDCLGLI